VSDLSRRRQKLLHRGSYRGVKRESPEITWAEDFCLCARALFYLSLFYYTIHSRAFPPTCGENCRSYCISTNKQCGRPRLIGQIVLVGCATSAFAPFCRAEWHRIFNNYHNSTSRREVSKGCASINLPKIKTHLTSSVAGKPLGDVSVKWFWTTPEIFQSLVSLNQTKVTNYSKRTNNLNIQKTST
jgi:hypothetical protein